MMLGGLVVRPWNTSALVVYFCIWLFLMAWTWNLGHRWSRVLPVMWASLNCGRPAHAVWRTSGFGSAGSSGFKWWYWIWIWNFYSMRIWNKGFQRFPTGSHLELVLAISCTSFVLIVIAEILSEIGTLLELKGEVPFQDARLRQRRAHAWRA
jgi:hypothetical protein